MAKDEKVSAEQVVRDIRRETRRKYNATDPAALLADAALAASTLKDDRELRLIESTLQLAQNALSQDKKQLANQIRGRLLSYQGNRTIIQTSPCCGTLFQTSPVCQCSCSCSQIKKLEFKR